MGYNVGNKIVLARLGIGRPTVGSGGPMVNPRAPGFRTGLALQPSGMRDRLLGINRGDPGIFGAIGKALGSVAKVVGKGVGSLALGAIRSTPLGGAISSVLSGTRIGAPTSRTMAAPYVNPGSFPGMNQLDFSGGGGEMVTVGGGGPGTSVALCAPAGYHLNKSGYWLNESDLLPGASWVAPRTRLVKNRKQNPFNPRAASRAMARLGNLYRGMKVLDKQMTKVARGAGARSPTRRAGACGCAAGRKGK